MDGGDEAERWAVALLTAALEDEPALYLHTLGTLLQEARTRAGLVDGVTTALADHAAQLLLEQARRHGVEPELVMRQWLEVIRYGLELERVEDDAELQDCAEVVQARAMADHPLPVGLRDPDTSPLRVQDRLDTLVALTCTALYRVCTAREEQPEVYLRRWGADAAA